MEALNLAVMAYASDVKTRRVFYFRHALRIGTHRWAIDLIRGAVAQRLMGTLVVIFRPEPVKRMLLGAQARARTAAVLFQGQMHPFMATVLLGVPGDEPSSVVSSAAANPLSTTAPEIPCNCHRNRMESRAGLI